mmetsp:Transcript_13995/g.34611  ORF Transcript_13995/g.34611 Transcript_13995/m.34611 type:complete len:289 (+) Transcript_13995:485-1351(+)|eukprot:g4143.t1
MEIILYLLGNWCCIAAASIILYNFIIKRGHVKDSERDLQISKDMQLMQFFGTLLRFYWSMSPPPIWSEEPVPIQWVSIADLIFSSITWGLCVCLTTNYAVSLLNQAGGVARNGYNAVPGMAEFDGLVGNDDGSGFGMSSDKKPASALFRYTRWPYLTAGAAVVAWLLTHLLPSLHMPGAWILVDFAVVFNMLVDGCAMIPQVILIHSSRTKTPVEASHFVGLLCLGRLLRMIFWLWLVMHPESGHAIWTFVIPDLLHTVIMADYLYHYLQKLKRDRIDPYFGEYLHHV